MTCYALFASDAPEQVCYVGATASTLKFRLAQYLTTLQSSTKRANWIKAVLARGAKVQIKALSEHQSWDELMAAERDWIRRLASAELTNSAPLPTPVENKWTVQLRAWRKAHGKQGRSLSIGTAAARIGVSFTTWYRWESGEVQPSGLAQAALEILLRDAGQR